MPSEVMETNKEIVEEPIEKIHPTIVTADDRDNYHGLDIGTITTCLSTNFIFFAQLLTLIGAGAVASNIVASIGGNSQKTWLSQGVVIPISVLSMPVSQAADYWGRKWFIVCLTTIFCIGSIVTSRAQTMGVAILGQVISGIGSSCLPLLYAVPSEVLPRRFRPAAQASVSIMGIALGSIFGLLVSATLVKKYDNGWRLYWYIIIAISGLSALVTAIFYKPPPRPLQRSMTTRHKLAHIDWVGNILLVVALPLLIIALTWSDNPFSWNNAHILAPFILGILFLFGLGFHQWRLKKDGILNHALFEKDRNLAIALLLIFVEGAIFFAAINFMSFEVAVLFTPDPFQVGLRGSIAFFTMIVASVAIAIFSSVTKTIRIPTVLAFISFTVYNVTMATATLSSSKATYAYPLFFGLGIGICLTCIVAAAQLSGPPDLIATTSGLLITIRALGSSVGIAVFTAMLNSKLSALVVPDIANDVLPLGLPRSDLAQFIGALTSNNQTLLASIPGVTPPIIQAGVHGLSVAYLTSFRYVWIIGSVLSFVGVIAACFLIDPKKDFNMHVDAPLNENEASQHHLNQQQHPQENV